MSRISASHSLYTRHGLCQEHCDDLVSLYVPYTLTQSIGTKPKDQYPYELAQ